MRRETIEWGIRLVKVRRRARNTHRSSRIVSCREVFRCLVVKRSVAELYIIHVDVVRVDVCMHVPGCGMYRNRKDERSGGSVEEREVSSDVSPYAILR